ncbi:MAG: YfhO family protein, partial [Phycisphaerales bacterium]|nr:YfhO family protein [Phycisphaerales bacterium]
VQVVPEPLAREVVAAVGDGRAAIDLLSLLSINRRIDDASVFDSLILARSYRAMMALKRAPTGYNNQWLSVNIMDSRMLRFCAVRVIATLAARPWMELWRRLGPVNFYRLEGAAERAAFVPMSRVMRGTPDEVDQALRDPGFDPIGWIIVEDAAAPAATQPADAPIVPARYSRPNSDRIVVELEAPQTGYVRIVEAFDPGWRGRLNGRPTKIVPANLMLMAVRVEPGWNRIELQYHTPGLVAGCVGSAVGLATLLGVAWWSVRREGQAMIAQELQHQRLDAPTQ